MVRATIVAVEDDTALLDGIVEVLADEGYRVIPVRDWREAYRAVCQTQPDLVLLDLRADGAETGWVVLNQLTVNPATRDVPVVLTTAAAESVAARRPALLPEYGISVLLKPFALDALCATVAQALRPRAALTRMA